MEEKRNKYHGGKIYTLRSPSTDKIYIGSTYNSLAKRKAEHKTKQTNEISKLDDFYIELLENFKCENRDELNKREGELIRQNKDKCINHRIAGRSQKEYQEINKEKIKAYKIQWCKDNKEKMQISWKKANEKRKKNII